MSRGKQGIFTFVAALATVAVVAVAPGWAVDSDPVASTDDKAPEAPTNLSAFPGAAGVELTWDLSASDFVRQSPTGTDLTSGGTFVNVNDVAGYNIYRLDELIDSVDAGETMYIDALAVGASISYTVTAFDAAGNESDPSEPALVSLGAPPVAVIADAAISIDNLGVDEVGTGLFTIQNTSADPTAVLLATISVVGATPGFTVTPTTVQVQPGATQSVQVAFDAAVVDNFNGDYAAVLRVRTNDPDNAETLIDVSASITGGYDGPAISIDKVAIRYGQLPSTDRSRTVGVVITNTGDLPLIFSTAFNTDSPAYSAYHLTDMVLEAGASFTFGVTINPSAGIGGYERELIITSNDPDRPEIVLPLSGTVVTAIAQVKPVQRVVQRLSNRFTGPLVLPGVFSLDANNPVQVREFLADLVKVQQAIDAMIARVAQMAGISPGRIKNGRWVEGSLIFVYDVAEPETGSTEPSAAAAVTTIQTTLADTTQTNPLTEVGTVSQTTTEVATEDLYPRDASGVIVLGWFTRTLDSVGLEDFYSFSDRYGKRTGDAIYSEDYDLSPATPDGVIDLLDFYTFADNYGRVITNAADIRAALQ